MFRPACVAVGCQTQTSAHYRHTLYSSSSSRHARKAVAQSSKSLHTDSVRDHKSRHAQQRCRHCACQASKPKSSEHPPDNGTEERKSSNSEAGTSGADTPASQKPSKPPNNAYVDFSESICFIESRDSVKSFSHMQLEEIQHSIELRRNRIFLLMEEVRRLRIQQRVKGSGPTYEEEVKEERYPSAVPFLPPLSASTVKYYYQFYAVAVGTIILFGGLLSPALEVNLGLGGTTYSEFIRMMHLPSQLAHVDPIVASFCGGAVGVLSAFMVVEANNAKAQEKRRCQYCEGGGYLTCGNCAGSGSVPVAAGKTTARNGGEETCPFCSGTGKVMCTACLV
ncbi:hypothetical protein ABBQ32_008382 [Trebouxia sp. C0010 RCD-2024]